MDFKDILEEKMTATEDHGPRFERGASTADPAHLAFLLGTIPVRRFQQAPPKSFRPANKMTKPTAPKKPVRARRPDHVLTERQKTAATWFTVQGEPLEPDFTADELKKAFRALARRLHPDAGGTASLFLELKGHHAVLRGCTP